MDFRNSDKKALCYGIMFRNLDLFPLQIFTQQQKSHPLGVAKMLIVFYKFIFVNDL
jgi:hypothetical protein